MMNQSKKHPFLRIIPTVFFFILFLQCKSDYVSQESKAFTLKEDSLILQSLDLKSKDTLLNNYDNFNSENQKAKVKIVSNSNIIEEIKSVKKDQVVNSVNRGLSCNEVLIKLSQLIDKIKTQPNNELVHQELAKWTNDIIFNNCRNSSKDFEEAVNVELKRL